MHQEGLLPIFANIRNASVQYLQGLVPMFARYALHQEGLLPIFANIRNASAQYSQGLVAIFASICDASRRISSYIRKYLQRKHLIFARISFYIRKHLRDASKRITSYIRK